MRHLRAERLCNWLEGLYHFLMVAGEQRTHHQATHDEPGISSANKSYSLLVINRSADTWRGGWRGTVLRRSPNRQRASKRVETLEKYSELAKYNFIGTRGEAIPPLI